MKSLLDNVDFGKTADDYLTHRAGFPDSLFDRLLAMGIGQSGQKIVDLGTGTGTLGRGLALNGASVIGIDPSAPMLEAARKLDSKVEVTVDYRVASAEHTALPADSADIVTAGQCWHWFDAPAAASEVKRILKQDGQVLLANYDWIPTTGNVARLTEELIEKHNPDWQLGWGTGIHARPFRDLAEAGFSALASFSYDEPAIYSHEGWRGRIRASAGIAATLDSDAVLNFDQELAALLKDKFPEESLQVPHRVFVLHARL